MGWLPFRASCGVCQYKQRLACVFLNNLWCVIITKSFFNSFCHELKPPGIEKGCFPALITIFVRIVKSCGAIAETNRETSINLLAMDNSYHHEIKKRQQHAPRSVWEGNSGRNGASDTRDVKNTTVSPLSAIPPSFLSPPFIYCTAVSIQCGMEMGFQRRNAAQCPGKALFWSESAGGKKRLLLS